MASSLRDQLQSSLGAAYTIERELGGGGMSRVYVAEETAFRRKVVVKLLAPELVAGVNVDRFKREIQLAARLQHPHIVPVITAGESDGLPYYTMPFVEGESLRARLAREGRLPIADAVAVLRDVAKALAYAHDRGIVHRDIKPDNVLLSGGWATVADFGIAKALDAAKVSGPGETLTSIGTSIGTPTYMAPEQAAADPSTDHRADLYSFGCMAYEMLAGQPPFAGKTPHKLLAAHMGERPRNIAELRPDAPIALTELVMRCLEKDPDARPQQVSDVLAVLETTTSGSGYPAAPALQIDERSMFRKALWLYLAAFVVVAVLTRAAIVAIGLPDWVFTGALIVMALGLPAILFTGYAQSVTRRALTATPTFTPGGSPSMQQGTMATMALKASPHLSWKRTSKWGMYALGGFIALVGAAMAMRVSGIGPFATLLSAGTLEAGASVIVAEFTISNSPDTSLGRVISEAVKADLGQMRAVGLVSDADVTQALTRMERQNARLLLPVAQQVAARVGAKAILDGSLSPLGNGFLVKLRLVTADSARELASVTDAANSPSELIDVVGGLTRKLRAKMGESLKSVRSSPKLADVTTGSLPALRKYTESREVRRRGGASAQVQRLMREAIAFDSNFAMAYYGLAVDHGNARERAESARMIERAFRLRDRVPARERFLIEWWYYRDGPVASRDLARAAAASDSAGALIPRGANRSGMLQSRALEASSLGDFKRADSLFRVALAEDTLNIYPHGNLLNLQMVAGWRTAAETTASLLARRFPAQAGIIGAERQAASGDISGAQAALRALYTDTTRGSAQRRNAAGILSQLAGNRGALKERERWLRLALSAGPALRREIGLLIAANEAEERVLAVGDTASALRLLTAALMATPMESIDSLDRPYRELASAYAAAGRPDRAKAYLAGVEKQLLEADSRRASEISIPRAQIAMAEKRWADAIVGLRATMPGRCATCLYRARGDAFAGAGQADSAIVWYQRWVTATSVPGLNWVVVQRRLGELYESKGDLANAIAQYQKFVEAWKNADPELQPQVAEVKKRIVRLIEKEGRGR